MHRHLVSAVLMSTALLLCGCGPPISSLDKLAAAGSVNPDAPVSTHLQISIHAPRPRVWAILINASEWPGWAPQIESVSIPHPLGPGQSFEWKTNGGTIHSQVQLFESTSRLAWTGTMLTAKAIHTWQLADGPDGSTTVTVSESMDGPWMRTIYPSDKLAETDRVWLRALQHAAESMP